MRKMNPFTAVQTIERSLLRITCDGKNLEIHLSPVNISPAQMAELIDDSNVKEPAVADLADENERLKTELKEANDALRSAYSVARRSGAHTDWPNLATRLETLLQRQHRLMYPNRYTSRDQQPITFHELPPVITGKQIKEAAERSREIETDTKTAHVPKISIEAVGDKIRIVDRLEERMEKVTYVGSIMLQDNYSYATEYLKKKLGVPSVVPPLFYEPKDTTLLLTIRHGSYCYSIDFDGNMTPSVNWHGNVTKQLTQSDALHRLRAFLHKARKDLTEPKELEFTHTWPDRPGVWAARQEGVSHPDQFWLSMPTDLEIKNRPSSSNYTYAFICQRPFVKR